MNTSVLQILCSDYGRLGTIGYRANKINANNQATGLRFVVCRSGRLLISRSIIIIPLYPVRLLAIIFAILRIKFSIKYNFRQIEVFIFTLFSIPFILVHSILACRTIKVVHCWDHNTLCLIF